MSIFEIGMLVCFGFAWPANIVKSLKSKTAKGKSLMFLIVVLIGYICGITHKLIYNRDIVIVLYIINFLMVLFDTFLYFKNKKLDRKNDND
jgi:hypothetical protein